MYVNKVGNRLIKIKNEDLLLALERYNLDNFEILETINGEKAYINKSNCPFCKKYIKNDCIGCPFKQFETQIYDELVYGCENLVKLLIPNLDLDDIYHKEDEIVFYESEGKYIKRSIQEIYDFFSSFKQVD
jgi:hypothetical protein